MTADPHRTVRTTRGSPGGTASGSSSRTTTSRRTSGPTTFSNLPWVTDPAEIARRGVDVAVIGRAVRRRHVASAGRALRPAGHPGGAERLGIAQLAPARRRALRGADGRRRRGREHRPELDTSADMRSSTGRCARWPPPEPSPSSSAATTRSRGRQRPRWRRSGTRAPSGSSTSTRTPTRARTCGASSRRTARRCAGSSSPARSPAATSSRWACAATGRRPTSSTWMRAQGMRWHLMREIEERGAEAVIDQAIDEALDGADAVYLSIDIDVIDPGMAPAPGRRSPAGC